MNVVKREFTTMSGKIFRNWLNDSNNQQFWLKPIPSEHMDKLISQVPFQKSIAGSKKNQLIYSYIENKIVLDYTNLIDLKLRGVFKNLDKEEFREPNGFENKAKSSLQQKQYFELRDQLEFFLKHDIQQHQTNPDAQLNAFRRWVEVSDSLLKRHCYEGFLLIFINVQLIAKPHLINGLPPGLQQNYQELCRLSAPDRNHSALRQFIATNSNERDFTPLIFSTHAITMLNESIINIRQQELLLKSRRKEVYREIIRLQGDLDPVIFKTINNLIEDHQKIPRQLRTGHLYLIDLLRENRRIPRQIKRNHGILAEQFEQRSNLINLIEKEQSYNPKTIPDYLEKTYNRITSRYKKNKLAQLMDVPTPELVSSRNAIPSRLYSQHLLPSFWHRSGRSVDKHWNEVFTPSCLHIK